MVYTDRTQSRVGRRSVRGAFLSSSSRSAPPRDIMLEEPDVMNPGHTDTCVLPSVFVYYMYVYTMPEKFSILVYCVLYVCMYTVGLFSVCIILFTTCSMGTHSWFGIIILL